MFGAPLLPVPPLGAAAVSEILGVALDPEQPGVARVRALHRLRGVGSAEDVARALVMILNEPLHWVASEALAVINALAPTLAIGVRQGLLRAIDDDELVDDGRFRHSPGAGPTAVPFDLTALPDCPPLPWTFRRPAAVVLETGAVGAAPELRMLTADGARVVEIGPGGDGPWRRVGPRLRVTFRHGDCLLQRLPDAAGEHDRVVTVNATPLLSAGITVKRLTAGDVVDLGTGVVHAAGVAFDDAHHHRLRVRAFIPERPGRGLAMVNDAMRAVGEVYVVPRHGHVVTLDDEEFGVVAVDSGGVHVHRGTLGELVGGGVRVGPLQLRTGAARNGRRQLLVAADEA